MRVIVVLGGGIDIEGNLDAKSKARVEKGVEEFRRQKDSIIIMSGCYSLFARKILKITEAESMKRYAIKLGVKADKIFVEDKSVDTFSNIYFSRLIIDRKKIKDIMIVSSNYHLKRVRKAVEYIFGNPIRGYNIDYVPAKSKMNIFQWIYVRKLEIIFRMIYYFHRHDIISGDMKSIKKFMNEKHPYYMKHNI